MIDYELGVWLSAVENIASASVKFGAQNDLEWAQPGIDFRLVRNWLSAYLLQV